MTRPIAQNADPAFTAGGKGGGKGTFRLLNGEWRVWGNETGTQLVSRLGWPALRTNCVAQAQLARRPLHPLVLTERSAPLDAHAQPRQFLRAQRRIHSIGPIHRAFHRPR